MTDPTQPSTIQTQKDNIYEEDVMKQGQGLSPKYWMGHHKQTDDVMLFSASKNRLDCCKLLDEAYGEDWFMDENFEVILVEINQVNV